MKRRMAIVATVIAAGALLLSACGGGGGGAKIGILLPSSGDLADLGKPMVQAAQLAVDDINAAGGIWGGTDVTGVVKDSATAEDKGRDMADQLVNVDKVSAITGAAGSGISKAALAVAGPASVPMCSPASTSPEFTTGDTTGMFVRTAPSDSLQGVVLAKLFIDKGYTTAADIGLDNPYGKGLADVFAKQYQAMGGKLVVPEMLYDPKGTQFNSEVQKITDANPQAVLLVGYPDTASIILKEAAQTGLLPKAAFFGVDGTKDAKLAANVGKDSSGKYVIAGMLGTAPASTGPGWDTFIKEFKDKNGEQMATAPYLANTYDCVMLEALALEKVGKDHAHDGKAIVQAMIDISAPPGKKISDFKAARDAIKAGQEIDFQGASSTLDLNKVGDVLTPYDIWQIQDDGSVKNVDTISPPSS